MEINYSWNLEEEAELSEAIKAASFLTIEQNENEEVSHELHSEESTPFNLELDHFDEIEQENKLWQVRTGLNFDTLCGAVETLIFMSDRPVSLQKIRSQIDEELPLRVLHEAIEKLQSEYELKHHGIRLAEIAQGYQFRTKATYAKYIQNLFKFQSLVLTPTALEVLAIVAYKQPVSKTEIEKIRGVDSSHIVRALMDKRLIKIVGRSEELGRPSLFGTTEEFLEVFNLAHIDQLPSENELTELATKPEVAAIADIKSVVFGGDREKFQFDELEELDRLSESIKEIAADTDFTMLLKQEEKRRLDSESTDIKKSAFDILEEFVIREESTRENQQASQSEPLMTVIEPKLADLNSLEPLNAPEVDSLWEAEQEEVHKLSQEREEFSDLDQEALELEAALENAFAELTGEKLPSDEELTDADNIDNYMKNLDFSVDLAIKEGMELDLDLSFLQDMQGASDKPQGLE